MPIIEMPDGTQVDLGDNPSPELKAAAAAKVQSLLGTQQETPAALPSAPPDVNEPPPAEAAPKDAGEGLIRGGQYVGQKALDVIEATSRLTDPHNLARPPLETAQDVGTVGGAVAAPLLTVGGALAGGTSRAFGATPEQAENINLGTQLVAGGYQAVKGGIQAARSAGPAVGKYLSGLIGPGTEEAAGQALGQVPGIVQSGREAARAATYGASDALATSRGLAITPGSPEATQLVDAIQTNNANVGAFWRPAERRVAARLTKALGPDATKPVTWTQLNQYDQALQKLPRGTSSFRGVIGDAMDRLAATDPDVAALRQSGQEFWSAKEVPTDRLTILNRALEVSKDIRGAQTPVEAFTRTIGKVNDPERASLIKQLVSREDWEGPITQGFYQRLFGGVTDAKVAVGKWKALPDAVRDLYDPSGKVMDALQGYVEAGPGGLAKALSLPVKAAPHLAVIYESAKHGNWTGVAYGVGNLAAALARPGPPGRLATGLAGAAAPLLRTGAAVSGQVLSGLSDVLPSPSTTTADESAAPEQTAPAPAPTPVASPPPAPTTTSERRATAELGGGTFSDQAMRAADIAGVPRPLMAAVMAQESAGRPGALNPTSGATGLMQLMPGTFAQHAHSIEGITGRPASIRNPVDNLLAGALELRKNLEAAGGSTLGTAAYYYGGMDPRQHGPKTRAYAARILQRVRSLTA